MIVSTMMAINGIICLSFLWLGMCSINKMNKLTDKFVKWSIILKTTGVFVQVLATLDFFMNGSYAWPWLILGGVVITNSGIICKYFSCRRAGCNLI